jgi:hypothetical protein
MARMKLQLAIAAAVAAVFLAIWANYEDIRLPWQKYYSYEIEHPGCAVGFISPDYAALKLPGAFTSFYLAWGDKFPAAELKRLPGDRGILALSWEPYLKAQPKRSLLADISAGKYDAYMAGMAAAIKAYGGPVLLRWGHEPNGDWYAWSGAANGKDAAAFKSAWRRMAGIMRAKAGPRMRLVFSVNSEDMPGDAWNAFENYYPGGDYADAVGIDAYNWGDTRGWSHWSRPAMLLKAPYRRALAMAPDKPLFLTEVASCPSGGSRAAWVMGLFRRLGGRYSAIKGALWFDYDKECDWRISTDPQASNAYMKALKAGVGVTADPAALNWFFEGGKNGR